MSKKKAKKKVAKKKVTKKRVAKKRATKKVVKKAKAKTAKKTVSKKRETKKKAVRKTAKKVAMKKPTKKRSKKKASKRKVKKDNELILVAVRGMVLFPGVILPIAIGRPSSVRAIQAAVQSGRPVGVILQSNPSADSPEIEDLHTVGTQIDILRYVTAPDGTHHVVAQGAGRFRVTKFGPVSPFFTATVEPLPEVDPRDLTVTERRKMQARFLALKAQAHQALELLPQAPGDLDAAIENTPHPGQLADLVSTFMDISPDEKQAILEMTDLETRLQTVSTKLADLTQVLKMSSDIRDQTKGSMEKAQREYFLREQLRTIKEELGEGSSMEVKEIGQKLAEAGMPEDVEAIARKELVRLERIPESAAEYSMVRTYLEWMLDLPWNKATEDQIDLVEAEKILDEDHYGLHKVKRRILEFLAVRRLKPDGKSPILCLSGPPGTGKTSLGRSIARAMAREFTRVSLGGVHDEAEIRGHRRTYVGAMPGNVIQSIKRAGVNNPVFLFDEMDKLGQGFHGDPASALLEVLDPAQNRDFRDHYLDAPFDLSRVLFLATANYLENIPGPLRDRMEVIELSSYTEAEKIQIAKRYLLPRQTEENGLCAEKFTITDEALTKIVRRYTREAGCRNLEREIGNVARHTAAKFARELGAPLPVPDGVKDEEKSLGLTKDELEAARDVPFDLSLDAPAAGNALGEVDVDEVLGGNDNEPVANGDAVVEDASVEDATESVISPVELLKDFDKITIEMEGVHEILGPERYDSDVALRTSEPGVATGLAWTPVGGVILFVEATKMLGKGNLKLTGQLGDVMQESAQAAFSLLKTRADRFRIDRKVFETTDIHIHLPEGATPKDGPSAGVTLYTTLVSLFTGRTIRSDVAMTGEINLRGLVLPVGGIKEKVLAAYSAGLRTVILPKRNEKDLEEIPKTVREEMIFHPVSRVGEVLDIALSEDIGLAAIDPD